MTKMKSIVTALFSTHAKKFWNASMIVSEYLETDTKHRIAPSSTVRAKAALERLLNHGFASLAKKGSEILTTEPPSARAASRACATTATGRSMWMLSESTEGL